MYVPKKQEIPGTYEGVWSGPYPIMIDEIRRSHKTRPEQRVAKGYENVPIRIQRIDSDNYKYQVVDGNKRLILARKNDRPYIFAYVWEGKDGTVPGTSI